MSGARGIRLEASPDLSPCNGVRGGTLMDRTIFISCISLNVGCWWHGDTWLLSLIYSSSRSRRRFHTSPRSCLHMPRHTLKAAEPEFEPRRKRRKCTAQLSVSGNSLTGGTSLFSSHLLDCPGSREGYQKMRAIVADPIWPILHTSVSTTECSFP